MPASYYDLNGPQRLTVLVVDDSPAILTIFGELLAPHYNVRVASSGKRALELVETAPTPDIILLDVLMPEMDGYAVLKALQDNPVRCDIPVILVTSLDEHENEEVGLARGAVDFFHKPINPALLLARIKTYLKFRAERNALVDEIGFLCGEIRRLAADNQALNERHRTQDQNDPAVGSAMTQASSESPMGSGVDILVDGGVVMVPLLDQLPRIPMLDDHESLCLC